MFRGNGQKKRTTMWNWLWLILWEHNVICSMESMVYSSHFHPHPAQQSVRQRNDSSPLFFFEIFFLFSTLILRLAKIIFLAWAIILWVRHFYPNQLITRQYINYIALESAGGSVQQFFEASCKWFTVKATFQPCLLILHLAPTASQIYPATPFPCAKWRSGESLCFSQHLSFQ